MSEPELFICPNNRVKCFHPSWGCSHRSPHPKDDGCVGTWGCPECIPYKEPVNVKGDLINSLQEEGKSPIQHLQDRVLELEQHQGRDRADLMEKIGRSDATIKDLAVESQRAVDDIETEIRTLTGRQDLTRDKVKELEDKTSRELSQAFAEVSRVLAEHREVGNTSRDRIDILDSDLAAVMRVTSKQKDQIKGLEHRLRLAQDRIAEIHPGGCVPPVKSQPKSQLKTDRVKKVTK